MLKRFAVEVGRHVIMPRSGPRVVVLCYHSVSPSVPFTSASPREFERQLMWLRQHCEVVGFSEVLSRAAREVRRHRAVVAITFDDGYADNYEFAFPLLQRYGLSATFFLTAGLVEKDPVVIDRFCTLRRTSPEHVRALQWSEAAEMHAAGMEIGAHTYSHPNLASADPLAVEGEVRRAKEIIEGRLGICVTSMAYPFGKPGCHFTLETMGIVSSAGYERAASVTHRPVTAARSPYAVPRFVTTQDTVHSLRDKIFGAWDLIGLWQENAPLVGRH